MSNKDRKEVVSMRDKRQQIQNMLFKAEEYQDGVKVLIDALDTLKKEGGKVTLNVYTKSGRGNCTSELSERTADKCLKILIEQYEGMIVDIKIDIDEIMDLMIGDYSER